MRLVWLACVILALSVLAYSQRDRVVSLLRGVKSNAEHRSFVASLTGARALPEALIAMPDGVRLAMDVYLPDPQTGPVPTVLLRLPYGKRRFGSVRHWARLFLAQGYGVAVQDMRGRYRSEGVFAPYPDDADDGAATLDWIVAQGWSDGQVGSIGCSALGETQVLLASKRHPAHKAMIPLGAGGAIGTLDGSYGFFGFFDGGILNLASAFGWFVEAGGKTPDKMGYPRVDYGKGLATLPLRDAVAQFRNDPTDFTAFLDRFDDPAYWQNSGFISAEDHFSTPFLIVDGWYDRARESLQLARQMRATGAPGSVVILPALHCDLGHALAEGQVGDLPLDPAQAMDFDALFVAMMNHRMKQGPAPDLPPVFYYLLGANEWRRAEEWPPRAAGETVLYLDGAALSEAPAPEPGRIGFTSDPMNPVPSIGGTMCCTGEADLRAGPLFQNPIEERRDLRLLTGAPLEAALTIAGPVEARLYVSTDVPDTDLVLRLTDVDPEGRSLMITEGSLRLRYRDGMDRPSLMPPGAVVEATVILRDIAYQVPAGHRLRLHVAGSSYPRLARNMNGGGDPYAESDPHPARITLHSGADTPSRLRLLTLPGG
ncbi:CocE/NonD family hydrolase [Pseudooceanicola sp.]|uniref:CocE/NonD family hydrolase n=1 Tax=Pseudooceanicola sp. TaxID=1914328 RepID=UPI002609C088|nr:CocE/NonD family hydrolase [Pseudooceanicola sp.]MDF1856191.1 CocE/NonD family hydrolase [Pseudooceanicola sp.]